MKQLVYIDNWKLGGDALRHLTFAELGFLFDCQRVAAENGGIVPEEEEFERRLGRPLESWAHPDALFSFDTTWEDESELLWKLFGEMTDRGFLRAHESGGYVVEECGKFLREVQVTYAVEADADGGR